MINCDCKSLNPHKTDKLYEDNSVNENEVELLRNRNEDTMNHLQDLAAKVKELKGMWKIHLKRTTDPEKQRQTTNGPKKLFNSLLDGSSELVRLEKELISCHLNEVEAIAELKEWKIKANNMEIKITTYHNQLSRQDNI